MGSWRLRAPSYVLSALPVKIQGRRSRTIAASMSPWTEQDSEHFLDVGRFYVPDRARQVELVAALVPRLTDAHRVADICCGEGLLAEAVLAAQPEATALGLDGSPEMLRAAERRLAGFGGRFTTAPCDIRSLEIPAGAPLRGIVSSLALHHVDHAAKRLLYRRFHDALAAGGALVIADLYRPAGVVAWEAAAEGWDAAVRAADAAAGMGGAVWRRFQDDRWNWFRFPDDYDKPAALADELAWLAAAGFDAVDVYWADCGHAVYGGTRA
jgi:tRNA (cmo5U34)-methyltransferase